MQRINMFRALRNVTWIRAKGAQVHDTTFKLVS